MLEQNTNIVPGLSQLGEVLTSGWVHVGTVGGPWHPVVEIDQGEREEGGEREEEEEEGERERERELAGEPEEH